MMSWINKPIERASWRIYFIWVILFLAYEFVVFSMPGPWMQLIEAVGDESGRPSIPDLMYGFPEGQPGLALAGLSDVTRSYIQFNFIDLPYAFFSMMAAMSIIALAFKYFNFRHWFFGYILIVPVIYFAAEVIENILLGSMAAKLLPAKGAWAIVQQLSTTIKMTTYGINTLAGLVALGVCVTVSVVRVFGSKGGLN